MNIRQVVAGLMVCGALLAASGCSAVQSGDDWSSSDEKKARALFKHLCETQAYEKIYKTVADVDGYLWVSPWVQIGEIWSAEHIRQLRNRSLPAAADYCDSCLVAPAGMLLSRTPGSYAEVEDSVTARLTRIAFEAGKEVPFVIAEPTARYQVSFSDVATQEMLRYWIGGSKLRITDRKTGEILAERLSFARGNPSRLLNPDRGPWIQLLNCANDPKSYVAFTKKVLMPPGAKK